MGLLRDKFSEFALFLDALERGASPRSLDADDYSMFDRAVNERPPRVNQTVEQHMRKKNFFRWHRLKRDYRWLQRQMKKMGMNPEEARWYL